MLKSYSIFVKRFANWLAKSNLGIKLTILMFFSSISKGLIIFLFTSGLFFPTSENSIISSSISFENNSFIFSFIDKSIICLPLKFNGVISSDISLKETKIYLFLDSSISLIIRLYSFPTPPLKAFAFSL